MKCAECKFWQGNLRYGKWADCQRVVAKLEPNLLCCFHLAEDGITRYYFDVPYDPHDFKYWRFHSQVPNLLKRLRTKLPKGVRIQPVVELDLVFDLIGNGQHLKEVTIYYVQTKYNFSCSGLYC